MPRWMIPLLLILTFAVGCAPPTPEAAITITVNADGTSQVILVDSQVTVSDVLRELNITLGERDRVNPPGYSRVSDSMVITVVRVVEETQIIEEVVPYRSRTVLNDSLPAGTPQLMQAGVNGVAEITYRIVYENGVEVSRTQVRNVLITVPQDEVIMIGSQAELPDVTVSGTLVYIANGNAWIIRQNSANRRPLTLDGGVDGRVFDLSADGTRLLVTRVPVQATPAGETTTTPTPGRTPTPSRTPTPTTTPSAESFNSLWVIFDTTDPEAEAVQLDLENVLYAAWVPGTEDMIVYSTGEPRLSWPGWQANNDLWRARIGRRGQLIEEHQLLEASSGGIYGWWGTFFAFSPDGSRLAWAQPDAVGVLDPVIAPSEDEDEDVTPSPTPEPEHPLADTYNRRTLASFAPRNLVDFIWIPGLAWSPDGTLIATTTHGPPLGGENPEDSPIFHLTVLPVNGAFSVNLVERAGMWSLAQFAPVLFDETRLEGPIAYLEAIEPQDSVTGRYRLMLVDRDGSNRRLLFPTGDQPGFRPVDLAWQPFVWSPDGRQIAMIYQGNLYLIDTVTGFTQQLTGDGLSASPRWSP